MTEQNRPDSIKQPEQDTGSHKYNSGSTPGTQKQWTTNRRKVLFSWMCKPFQDVKHRHETVECRLVVQFTPDVGLDVLLEARSENSNKVPDDWTTMIAVEGRTGIATYIRKPEAKWLK